MSNTKTVLITGASRGIGKATALAFARIGFDVVINYRSNTESAQRVCDEISALGQKAWMIAADVRDEDQVKGMAGFIQQEVGSLSVLVNNAGCNYSQDIVNGETEKMWEIIGTVLVGKLLVTKYVAPLLIGSQDACIVNVGSRMGREKVVTNNAAYSAAQAGVAQLTRCMALELSEQKIRVNAVSPGLIDTDMTKEYWQDRMKDELENGNLVGRMGTSEEVAQAILFLASPDSGYINGTILDVTGGTR